MKRKIKLGNGTFITIDESKYKEPKEPKYPVETIPDETDTIKSRSGTIEAFVTAASLFCGILVANYFLKKSEKNTR